MTTSFTFNAPVERLSLNDRRHWANKARIGREWRQAVSVYARNHAAVHRLHRPLGPSVVHVEFFVAQHRRRDADNAVATVKHCVDGLVDAGWFVDDTTDRVATSVGFTVDPRRAGQVTIAVRPMVGDAA